MNNLQPKHAKVKNIKTFLKVYLLFRSRLLFIVIVWFTTIVNSHHE